MNVLVLNCGSSTVKFQLIATDLDHIAQDADEHLAGGVVERIGGEAILDFRARGDEPRRSTAPVRDVRAGVETVIRWVTSADSGIEEVKSVADAHADLYALPYQWYRRHRVRRYGFHGTSHRYVAYRYRKLRGLKRDETNIITLHLGNGCSA